MTIDEFCLKDINNEERNILEKSLENSQTKNQKKNCRLSNIDGRSIKKQRKNKLDKIMWNIRSYPFVRDIANIIATKEEMGLVQTIQKLVLNKLKNMLKKGIIDCDKILKESILIAIKEEQFENLNRLTKELLLEDIM